MHYVADFKCTNATCTNVRRVQRLNRQCKLYGNKIKENDDISYQQMFVDDRLKLLYCAMGKSGSTTFKYLMGEKYDAKPLAQAKFAHRSTRIEACGLYHLSAITNITRRRQILKDYKKFIVIRNPYSRLYSGYLQKSAYIQNFLDNYDKSKHDHHDQGETRRIIENHFPAVKVNPGAVYLTFEKFLQFLVMAKTSTVDSLKRTRNDINHRSIWDSCHPCHVQYDYIAKLETLSNDEEVFLSLFAEKEMPRFNVASSRFSKRLNKSTILDPSTAISQISSRTLTDIGKLYQIDMDLFGYGLDSNSKPISLV